MSHRQIQGLRWASRLAVRPGCIPQTRPRGLKAKGLKYERSLARELGPRWTPGQWWEFEDARGHGFCQTDLMLELAGSVVVLEAKLSWVMEGHTQLEQLYAPVIARALGKPVLGIQVAKVLRGEIGAVICRDLAGALSVAAMGRRPVLHWIGCAGLDLGPLAAGAGKAHVATGASPA